MSNAREAALAVITALASGAVTENQLSLLADAVLGEEPARLALEVRAGGTFAVRRAIELAALVLASRHPTALSRDR